MRNILKKIINSIIIILTFCSILISGYLIFIWTTLPDLTLTTFESEQDTKVYDSSGNKLNTLSYYNTSVSYNNISVNLITAVIAIEDNTFFSHHGINYKRMLKALYTNVTSFSFKEGASTINQQLIKNTILTSDKTINRKMSEVMLALKLERYYTKEQIIELYLNNILFGDNIYGIYDASLYYFNKEPSTLSIDEAATLAGIIQLPNFYNPYRNIDEATSRRNTVLYEMNKKNYISESDYFKAIEIDLSSKLSKSDKFVKESYLNPYLDYLDEYGYDTTAKSITTYLNTEIQKELYNIASNKYNLFNYDKLEVAMVALDNNTGGVLGIVGNRSFDKKVINHATIKRQMASTMKPIVDYALAFEHLNLSPSSLIKDEEYTYSDGTSLKNWDYQFKGTITLRQALKESRNIPALKLYQQIDTETRIEFLNKLGLYPDKPFYESEALGSGENTYSLLQIANSYLAFANNGKYIDASPIKEIYSSSYYRNKELKKTAMKESTSFFINSILHDVFKGTGYDLKNGYLCAKTGQTNFSDDTLQKYSIPYGSTKDSYLIAYTNNITFGVWVGYDTVSSTNYLDNYKTQIPRNIMKIFMNKFGTNSKSFTPPSNTILTRISIVNDELYLDNSGYYDYFLIGYEPKTFYRKKSYYET